MFRNLKIFIEYLRKYRKQFWIGTIALFIVDLLDVTPPLIIKYGIDHLGDNDRDKKLLYAVAAYILVVLIQAFFRYWMRIGFYGMSLLVGLDLRNKLFAHIQKLSVSFFNTTKTGDIMSRATNDIEAVRGFFQHGIFILIDNILYFTYVPIILLYLSPRLTLYAVLPLLYLPFFANRMGNLIHRRFKDIQEVLSEISAKASENFSGIRVVKSFTQEENEISGFRNVNVKSYNKNLWLAKLDSFFGPFLGFSVGVDVFVVILFGGLLVISGDIKTGTLVAFYMYLRQIAWPMMGMGMVMSNFQRATASMDRLQEIFQTKPEIVEAAQPVTAFIERGEIEFKNIQFSYPHSLDRYSGKESARTRTPALTDINLKIPAGSTVLVMGPIGSGKSTLANLLVRFFDPSGGDIFIDGVNIRNYSLGRLRGSIGFVPQDIFLFADTIKENVLFGVNIGAANEQSSDVQVYTGLVQMNEVIEKLPEKYNSLLGERGVNLSGGQKQRLTLSRAIAKKPSILILDDCFSSVDFETEQAILNSLKAVLKNRTTLIISHRLAAVKLAQFIVFMEDGRVVEKGTHQELMTKKGHYARFYEYQKLKESLEGE
ncbi:MAG: ABC transporter ATP-binding protein [Candidatus Brocadiia bacterium]